MKTRAGMLVVSCFAICLLVISTRAEAVDHQFALKVGHMSFIGEDGWENGGVLGDDSSEFNGRNWALEWDILTSRYFGLRFTLEYFHHNRYMDTGSDSYYDRDENRSLVLVPLTVSAKWKIPTPVVAPYFYIGLGMYSWGIYQDYSNSSWFWYDDDDDDLRKILDGDSLGFQMGTGLECTLGPGIALLMEIEYRALELEMPRRYNDEDINASSFLFSLGLLFR